MSVALVDLDTRSVLAFREQKLSTNASGMLLEGLQACLAECGQTLADVKAFAADTGPGSFIGARVGVTLAKTLAFAHETLCAGANAFDLIALHENVILPNRRSEWFVRAVGGTPERIQELPPSGFVGYGRPDPSPEEFPHAKRFALLNLEFMTPERLLPTYLVEPSISTPKKPYGEPVA